MAQPPSLDDDVPATAHAVADSGLKSQAALDDLVAKATARYAVKDYAAAAEFYSRATELQAELNGEMSTQNADLLYLYGRCLYQVAVQNSDVLGSKITNEEQSRKKDSTKSSLREGKDASVNTKKAESRVQSQESGIDQRKEQAERPDAAAKPYFNITGDENWDESDDELAEGDNEKQNPEEDGEEPDDDFSNAFEVLDIARVLLEKRLAELDDTKSRQEQDGKATDLGNTVLSEKRLKEKLGDTLDLQAEISLEAERFADAAADLRAALNLKTEIFSIESSMIAEAHYKLSLALEFSAIIPAVDADGQPQPGTVGKIDQKLRDDAALHMTQAIESCKARIAAEKKLLHGAEGGEYSKAVAGADGSRDVKITPQSVEEVEEMVTDMEQRLKELKESPVSVSSAVNPPETGRLGGILGSLVGGSAEDQRTKLEEAVGKANDLSNLVRKRKTEQPEKRKADELRDESAPVEKKSRQDEPGAG